MRPFPPLPPWVALEHEVAQILTEQELHGWYFDERSAWELASSLRAELEETYQLYVTGTLSSSDRALLLKSITDATGMSKTVK